MYFIFKLVLFYRKKNNSELKKEKHKYNDYKI